MDLYTAEECARLNALGQGARDAAGRMIRKLDVKAQTTGYGSVFNEHPLRNYQDPYPTTEQSEMAAVFAAKILERNVLVSPYGFVFSTAHRAEDVDLLLEAVEAALGVCAVLH